MKKTDYNAKINAIDSAAQPTLKNMLDNLVDINKLKKSTPDTDNFVLKTKFEKDIKDLDDKIPDVSGLATKINLAAYLQTTTFNSKVTEVENKITAVNNKIPDVAGFVKKTDYATDITAIKDDYATNASADSKINDLKAQHIYAEI